MPAYSFRNNKKSPKLRVSSSGKLTAAKRNSIPSKEFGLPGSRKYPVNDKKHAVLAKGRATQMEHEGKLSASSAAKIKAKANRKLGKA